ncbi:Gcd10p family-domain-containing protein [Stachybotrys elegans]|uniref:tRNA (adenine(58)-N(1))-methyltransferase non-catalytic subunit TRM6 n=1 Tax=Stachybotrys elegans TaxID=80388 RepID=A0A8K0WTR0_9HYPO|nr:Gcd10p family-domain-containing protein [Stachybotrys elegans]
MPRNTVQPNGWAAIRLPNDTLRILQIVPNTTISLGKYGSFPSNLIIERPFHLTYEVQDKRDGENFSRLRVMPASEVNADMLADTSADASDDVAEGDDVIVPADGEELTLMDETGRVVARSNREIIDDPARQMLTRDEIMELKSKGASAGKELIAKLLLSHTAIDQKTEYSLAKYKLLKTKKYIRRFTILPLDVGLLSQWLLEDRDAAKILELRQESIALIGCWADIHFGGSPVEGLSGSYGGRWLVCDDTGGLLVAAMAERMGILYHDKSQIAQDEEIEFDQIKEKESGAEPANGAAEEEDTQMKDLSRRQRNLRKRPRRDDLEVPYAPTNTITLVHGYVQPNLSVLRYFDFDSSDPNPSEPYHPLVTNLLPISWLQLLHPEEDPIYMDKPAEVDPEVLANMKTSRRGNYHRKRRRWARTQHIVNETRQGGFSGLAVASTMDPISVLRNSLPLLEGGAPIAIYSQNVEPLSQLAECFSVSRRASWVSSPPPEVEGKTLAELETWSGNSDFPINPTLVLGVSIQSSRARRWQVLPGRTHPFMTARGGAEGYILTGWKAVPVEGKISARGKFAKKRD